MSRDSRCRTISITMPEYAFQEVKAFLEDFNKEAIIDDETVVTELFRFPDQDKDFSHLVTVTTDKG